jgi:hypothetical protein
MAEKRLHSPIIDTTKSKTEEIRRRRVVLRTMVFTGALGAVLAGSVLTYLTHTDEYDWMARSHGSCVDITYIAKHRVVPGEDVALHIKPSVGDEEKDEYTINVSGKPFVVGSHEVCFQAQEFKDAEIIFQATNGDVQGEPKKLDVSPPQ